MMSPKRILVVGSNGLLGQKMAELLLRGSPHTVLLSSVENVPVAEYGSVPYRQLDITSKKEVRGTFAEWKPDIVVNCAAMTNVDACESERELAWKINVSGVENLIDGARVQSATIVHLSTDYIFDGRSGPYTEQDRPNPLGYYGKSKLASENALRASGVPFLIARTMVLYGSGVAVRPNFVLWLIESLEQGTAVRIVDDQYGNPTFVDDLAYGLLRAIELERTGIYHLAGREIVSRYEFALRIAGVFNLDTSLIASLKTSQLQQPAPRPLRSGLVTLKAEVELSYKPHSIEESLIVLRNQLSRTARRLGDSTPVPGQMPARQGSRGSKS
jgi:dTDP-4-dehydrorhamnose reductase